MINIRNIAQSIRHMPGIEKAEWFWNILRSPYHQILNFGGKGVRVSIGKCCEVSIPPEFSGGYWEDYEPETVQATVIWLKKHPAGLVLDIGCAIGIFSVIPLSLSEQTEVIAFDADLSSLKATQRICQFTKGNRLSLIYGLVSNQNSSSLNLSSAIKETEQQLLESRVSGDPGTTAYICIDGNENSSIPTHSLDGLLLDSFSTDKQVLIKCDVEGAELLVLQGAKQLLEKYAPDLLISVHPPALPSYGHSVDEVREYIESFGYHINIVAIDHEEHWWCEKK